MTQLMPFEYEGNQIRTATDEHGEPLIVASDVCRVLGIANSRDAIGRLDDDEKGVVSTDTPGGMQQMAAVTEPGFYRLVMSSRKPVAKPFQRWAAHEVFPSIRKRGGYLTPEATEAALTDPDFIIRLATDLKTERAKRAELEAAREADRPKVIFADAVSVSHTSILVGDLAKLLKQNGLEIGATRLFELLRRDGYLIARKGSDWNSPTQMAMELGLFEVKETVITHSDGHTSINRTPKVTGKGQLYFVERFLDGRLPKPDKDVAA